MVSEIAYGRRDPGQRRQLPSYEGRERLAGNVERNPPSRRFTVDTAFIDTTIEAGPDGATSDTTPSFTFSTSAP